MLAMLRKTKKSRLKYWEEMISPGETLMTNRRTGEGVFFSSRTRETLGEESTNQWCLAEKVMGGLGGKTGSLVKPPR